MKCKIKGCTVHVASPVGFRTGMCSTHRKGSGVPTGARTREEVQAQLDHYDNRIKCLQAGRANLQRTLDEFPVEINPTVLAALQERSELLADIEHLVRRSHRPTDPRSIGKAFVEYLHGKPNLFVGVRF